jgi:signal transduction histidine kinase
LTLKLLLAFLAVSLTVAVLGAAIIHVTTQRQFANLTLNNARQAFIDRATIYHRTTGSWRGFARFLAQGQPQQPQQQPGNLQRTPRPPQPVPNPDRAYVFLLADTEGRVIVPAKPYQVGEILPQDVLADGTPIEIDGETVGTVIATGDPPPLAQREIQFLRSSRRSLFYAALAAVAVALILSLLLTRGLTHPLRKLSVGMQATAQGELGHQVAVRSRDEIGQLAQAFNQMSADLARLNDQRRQMTADIAHDLRSPLTVIAGYVESMRDGVLAPSPERLETIQDEVQHLQRLVEDLRTLSLADAGELSLQRGYVAPEALLKQVQAAYRHPAEKKGVTLRVEAEPDVPDIYVDPDRVFQVLANLVSNAIRHTPEGGAVTMSSEQYPVNSVLFIVNDTGSGIPAEDLPRIFDRFYRVDDSRHGGEGESGLGLAIAKSIVEMHGGSISAASDGPGRGSRFMITLEAAEQR